MAQQTGSIDLKATKKAHDDAKKIAEDMNQYFWHTEEGTDTGAHITEIPREDFLADPDNGGGNLLARSNGIALREGLTELATFGADGARIGKETDSHLVISDESLQLTDEYGNNWLSVNAEVDVSTGSPASFTTHGDGTTTVFGLSFVIANVVSVAIDGVLQTEGTDFERVNNAIKFIVPPSNGSIIIIQYRPPGGSSNINYTFGERDESKSYGLYSVAEGVLTTASGWASHAEGHESIATGRASHAENSGVAEGERCHAEGYSRASGECSHAEGGTYDNTSFPTIASGDSSHAEGFETQATGDMAHAQNFGTLAHRRSQTAIGEYNVADYTGDHASRGKYALIIGNGTENTRSNALTVDWDGNVEAAGDVSAVNVNASGNVEAGGDVTDGNGNTLSAIATLLSGALKVQSLQIISSSTTIAAGGNTGDKTVTPAAITGYTPILATPRNTGGNGMVNFYKLYMDANHRVVFSLANPRTSSVTFSAAYVNVLYVKNELVG